MEAVRRELVVAPFAALVAIGALGVLRPDALGAVDPPWDPPPCSAGSTAPATGAWYHLAPQLDRSGTLASNRLTVGPLGDGTRRPIDLPPESFASGPLHGLVLVGDDDGRRSRLRIVDVGRSCAVEAGTTRDVVRSALLDADGRTVIEHRVDRSTRADLGVWRRPASGTPRQLLAGQGHDQQYGPTFATDLAWSADGRLVVASCGELACRTRVLDPRTGHVDRVERTGPSVGVAGDIVVAWAVCPGMPCGIDLVDLATGLPRRLLEGDGPATLGGPGGDVLVASTSGGLRLVDLGTGAARPATSSVAGAPVRGGSKAEAGADLPPGEVLLAPGGRFERPDDAIRLDPVTGAAAGLEEAVR
jgi:hypothetical protein